MVMCNSFLESLLSRQQNSWPPSAPVTEQTSSNWPFTSQQPQSSFQGLYFVFLVHIAEIIPQRFCCLVLVEFNLLTKNTRSLQALLHWYGFFQGVILNISGAVRTAYGKRHLFTFFFFKWFIIS